MPTCQEQCPGPARVPLLFPDNPGPWETCPEEPLEGGREVAPRGITRQQHQEEDGSINYRCQEPYSPRSRRRPAQPAWPGHCQRAWLERAFSKIPLVAPSPQPKALGQLSPGSTSSLTFLSSRQPGEGGTGALGALDEPPSQPSPELPQPPARSHLSTARSSLKNIS